MVIHARLRFPKHRSQTTLSVRPFQKGVLSVVLAGLFVWGSNATLMADADTDLLQPPAVRAESALDDPMAGLMLPKQRSWSSLNQIYEFDRLPLGQRIPVILVPGRAEEFQQDSWWKRFYRHSMRNSQFRHNFKLYVFLYNSKEELDVQAHGLAMDLRKRFGHLPESQPLMLVTYSLGGVIAREVLKEPGMLEKLDTQIAIAVPFHGSPLFDPDWFSQYLNPPNRSPVRRFWDRNIYRAYMFGKSNLTRGLGWDNFDRSKPQFDAAIPHQLAGDQVSSLVPPYVEYPMADEIRAKTIVFASYLENGYTQSNQPFNPRKLPRFVLDNTLSLPKEAVATVLPFYGYTVHSVFTYMNNQLANLPTYTPDDPQGENTHLYRFNDGAIPLSSMLFLKPSDKPYDQDVWELVRLANVRKTRIFVNLDHMDVGEYTLRKSGLVRPDLIHPEDGERSPDEWVMYDLLQRLQQLQALQTKPSAPNP